MKVRQGVLDQGNTKYIEIYILCFLGVSKQKLQSDAFVQFMFIKKLFGYNYIGHLFQDRYHSEVIETDGQLLTTSRYIHLNPVRANMVKNPQEYLWSSYKIYIGEEKEKLISSERITLKATITPSKASNKNLKWISSNTKIAKIDTKGKVTAVSVGSAMIAVTAADGNKKSYATITVVSNWANKKFVTFGDSITWLDKKVYNSMNKEQGITAKGYQTYMRNRLKCIVDNKGSNGNDMRIADILIPFLR